MADRLPYRTLKVRKKPKGLDVKRLQKHLGVTVDGQYGPITARAAKTKARALGVLSSTLTVGVTVGVQNLILGHTTQSRSQKRRATKRAAQNVGPNAAVKWAGQWVGKTESPYGSNTAPWGLTAWQRALGDWLVGAAWCGVFVGTALKNAGVKGINSRVASVALIIEDAVAGRNGWEKVIYRRSTRAGSVTAGKRGDAVGLFSESTHVELIDHPVPGGYATIGGNTSPAPGSGSESNGGGVYRRFRSYSDVAYIARPRY